MHAIGPDAWNLFRAYSAWQSFTCASIDCLVEKVFQRDSKRTKCMFVPLVEEIVNQEGRKVESRFNGSCRRAAPSLNISPRTLAHWKRRQARGERLRLRGRPCRKVAAAERAVVGALLDEWF